MIPLECGESGFSSDIQLKSSGNEMTEQYGTIEENWILKPMERSGF